MRLRSILAIGLCTSILHGAAQCVVEDVIVETYYVSDASDASDTISGGLAEGSRTYRVYVDLCDGCALRSIYGDANHALKVESTAPFFNHLDRGKTYGHEVNNSALDEGTVALDSWLSLGRGSSQKLGILKIDDPDGSIVGGSNNDGGSAAVGSGLLINSAAEIGVALTTSDGLVPLNGAPSLPPSFIVQGDDPSTVFRDQTSLASFVSDSVRIGCSTPGAVGPTTENRVLVAQLTTVGEISFELNVEVQCPDGTVAKYVARGDTLLEGEVVNGLLVYPPQCGCTDPNYLEYDPAAGCDDGSCATAIIFGCLDPAACNYSTSANFNVPDLCCYGPQDCNGLDITIVCPEAGVHEVSSAHFSASIAPNPAHDEAWIIAQGPQGAQLSYVLHDVMGRRITGGAPNSFSGSARIALDLSGLPSALYFVELTFGDSKQVLRFLKD